MAFPRRILFRRVLFSQIEVMFHKSMDLLIIIIIIIIIIIAANTIQPFRQSLTSFLQTRRFWVRFMVRLRNFSIIVSYTFSGLYRLGASVFSPYFAFAVFS